MSPSRRLGGLGSVLAVTLACSDDQVSSSPFGAAELAFVAPDDDGVEQLWLADARDDTRRQLSFDARNKALPTWSPDGELLAFIEFDEDSSCSRADTLVILDGEGRRTLASLIDVVQLAFDADGQSLLVVVDGCSEPGNFVERSFLQRVQLDGEIEPITSFSDRAVIDAAPRPGYFAISAGTWDTTSNDPSEWSYRPPDVYVGSPDGERTRIDDTLAYDTEVDWHPSGDRLVFQSDRNGVGEIYSIAIDGSDRRLEVAPEPNTHEFRPRWSPDGRTLLTGRLGWGDVPDGAVLRGQASQRVLGDVFATEWSADQTMLLVDDGERVIVFDLDDETQRDLGEGHDAVWRPRQH
jgi:dipeptidyl aminopeptidase/acylaminoacyl peptidase